MNSDSVLVIVSGASGAILLPEYVIHLNIILGCDLRLLMTKSAEQFVRPEVLRWFAKEVFTCETPRLNPAELALTSRGIIVLPASANTLACAALGLAGSPATTVLLAAPSSCLFFPHMNIAMWKKGRVQQHVATLRSEGHVVVDPEIKEVFEIWRGAIGIGCVMPPAEKVADIVYNWLNRDDRHEAPMIDASEPQRSGAAEDRNNDESDVTADDHSSRLVDRR
jgi:phosphopantothenoylcysteine decarboxylase